jgi:hypothetical protein
MTDDDHGPPVQPPDAADQRRIVGEAAVPV